MSPTTKSRPCSLRAKVLTAPSPPNAAATKVGRSPSISISQIGRLDGFVPLFTSLTLCVFQVMMPIAQILRAGEHLREQFAVVLPPESTSDRAAAHPISFLE